MEEPIPSIYASLIGSQRQESPSQAVLHPPPTAESLHCKEYSNSVQKHILHQDPLIFSRTIYIHSSPIPRPINNLTSI